MGWTTKESWFHSWQGQEIFLLSKAMRPRLGPTWLYIDWIPDLLCLDIKLKLSTHLHLAPRLRMTGDIPPFPFMVCREATSTLYFILLTITEFLQCAYRLWHIMLIFINICALKISDQFWLTFLHLTSSVSCIGSCLTVVTSIHPSCY